MSNLEFRAWNEKDRDMEYLHSLIWFEENNVDEVIDGIGHGLYRDYNIMQFTGLNDKNGKKIFEGDILRQFPGFGCAWKERVGRVNYQFASFWFDMGGQAQTLDDHDCYFEVIGNIYENPNLITVEK
jgi:uncharacterized phage protein (TIGR01671 family)